MDFEHILLEQILEISRRRNAGENWAKPLYHLRSLCVGIETKDFLEKWQNREVLAVRTAIGEIIEVPTESQMEQILHWLLQLLVDRKISFRKYITSKLGELHMGETL